MAHRGERELDVGTVRAVPHVGLFVCASLLVHAALVATWMPGGTARSRGGLRASHTLHATLALGSREAPASALPRSLAPAGATASGTPRASAAEPGPSAPTVSSAGIRDATGTSPAPQIPAVARAMAPDLAAWLAQQRAARGATTEAGLAAALQDLPAGDAGEIRCTLSPDDGPHCQGLSTPGLEEPLARILAAAGAARREGLLPSPAVLMTHGITIRVTWAAD